MSGDRKGPQARDRQLGARLRAIRREQTDLTLERAAELAQWSASTLSRIENGKRHISPEEVATILTVYGIPVGQREQLIESAKDGNASGWWDRPLPGVPPEIGAIASYESEAIRLTNWTPNIVPGLLQTQDYAVGVMLSDGVPAEDIQPRWSARVRRQEVLSTVDYTAFIGEAALLTPFGGNAALHGQLRHLHQAYERAITIRVVRAHVPYTFVLHSWLLMEFANVPAVVNVELVQGGVFLHDKEVNVYKSIRHRLDVLALSAPASRAMIGTLTEER